MAIDCFPTKRLWLYPMVAIRAIMGASRDTASVPVMGTLAPATIPVLGPADSPAAAPVMSAGRRHWKAAAHSE